MGPARDPHRPLTKVKQLLVEGRTPELFFAALAAHLRLESVEVWDFGSISQLTQFLKAFCARPEYKAQVQSLAIIRDAEFLPPAPANQPVPSAVERAFQSIRSSLAAAGQPSPDAPGIFAPTTPRDGVFVLPNCRDEGMLETLCLESVLTARTSQCIEQYFTCMETEAGPRPRNMPKARTFAFLATKDLSDALVGRAAQNGIWPWDCEAFQPLRAFLQAM